MRKDNSWYNPLKSLQILLLNRMDLKKTHTNESEWERVYCVRFYCFFIIVIIMYCLGKTLSKALWNVLPDMATNDAREHVGQIKQFCYQTIKTRISSSQSNKKQSLLFLFTNWKFKNSYKSSGPWKKNIIIISSLN